MDKKNMWRYGAGTLLGFSAHLLLQSFTGNTAEIGRRTAISDVRKAGEINIDTTQEWPTTHSVKYTVTDEQLLNISKGIKPE